MSKKFARCFVLLLLLVSACSSSQGLSPTSTITNNNIADTPNNTFNPPTTIIPEESHPTISPISTTPAPLPARTASPIQKVLTQQCFEENTSLPKEIIPKDVLGIKTLGKGILLRNFESGTQREISHGGVAAGTSPDGKWLVYEQVTNQASWLILESMEGKKSIQIPVDLYWYLFGHISWLDNQRIWFPDLHVVGPAQSVIVLDPFTNEKVVLSTDYPRIESYQGPSWSDFFGFGDAVYEPSLNFVIYPELYPRRGWYQTLWNRKTKSPVARILDDGSYGNLPIWQDSQQRFLLVGLPNSSAKNKEWVSVSLDGQVNTITDFGKLGRDYRIENNASLSPDGKTLAFGLNFEQDDKEYLLNAHLILLDLTTGKATDTCLPVGNEIAWSLDGKYLAISTPLEDGVHNKILLIDPNLRRSYQIMEGRQLSPVGWLIQP